jgi:AbrB family looped-hinge helix DNA binding protein
MEYEMLLSTLTTKGQATIPAEIRKTLDLKPGDKLHFEMHNHNVVLTKAKPFDHLYHASVSETLSEWNSPEDDEAYRDL